ncbi:MAG: reverse transcriptase domain-containing protein [archaeon]
MLRNEAIPPSGYNIKSILEDKIEKFDIASFSRPLLPIFYGNKFIEYYSSLRQPTDVLKNTSRYGNIVNAFIAIKPQLSLFDKDFIKRGLDDITDDLVKHKPLYRRWYQEMNGKCRDISVPSPKFYNFIKSYVLPFIKNIKIHPKTHGAEYGWTPKKSIETHLPMACALSFDMSDAFKQIDLIYVFDFYYNALGNYVDGDGRRDTAGFLATLSTVKYGRCIGLPIGSPISTFLFNRLLYPVDEVLDKIANEKKLSYSRWVDDFIVSSSMEKPAEYFGWALRLICNNFVIAPLKIFYHHNPTYLLGHKVDDGKITKISKTELKEKRGNPLDPCFYSIPEQNTSRLD